MKKLILSLFLLIVLTTCSTEMDKYEWLPTECAPQFYPVQIIQGDLFTEDGESVYIPEGKMVYNGWGNLGSVHVVGDDLKPLPYHLNITWFSFIEDKFYSGNFDLPVAEIKELFKEGYVSPISRKKMTYDKILVGLAPGGGVAVWVMGEQVTREVCFLKANMTETEWNNFVPNPDYPREKYIKLMLEEAYSTKDLLMIKKVGIPVNLWSETYRTQFKWEPHIIGKVKSSGISLGYFNGEREFIDYQTGGINTVRKRTVPKDFILSWADSIGSKYSSKVIFDEWEIFEALTRLNNLKFTNEIKLQIVINEIDQSLKILLNNDKYVIELNKCDIEVYIN